MTAVPSTPVASPRRRALMATAGLGALGGIAVAAWWAARTPAEVRDPLPADFWHLRFDRPAGGELSLQAWRGQRLLINFWATWCPPCVEELPLLNLFARAQQAQGLQVLGLAVDQPTAVRGFLQRAPLDFPVGLATAQGKALAQSLGNTSGGLPFSVLLGPGDVVRQRKIGKLSPEALSLWAGLR